MTEYIYDEAGVIEDETLGNGHRVFHLGMVRREEVVRCRDCKWFDEKGLCRRDMSCDEIAVSAGPDGYCAWAKRRDA